MQTAALVFQLSERLTAHRMFAEARAQDGVTVTPAARVLAGGGGALVRRLQRGRRR